MSLNPSFLLSLASHSAMASSPGVSHQVFTPQSLLLRYQCYQPHKQVSSRSVTPSIHLRPPRLMKHSPHPAVHKPASELNFRKMNYMRPQTHVNKMKKFQIYSAAFKPSPPAQGGLKRTSKKPEFQLKQCDHPRDVKIFLWLVRCALWTV